MLEIFKLHGFPAGSDQHFLPGILAIAIGINPVWPIFPVIRCLISADPVILIGIAFLFVCGATREYSESCDQQKYPTSDFLWFYCYSFQLHSHKTIPSIISVPVSGLDALSNANRSVLSNLDAFGSSAEINRIFELQVRSRQTCG